MARIIATLAIVALVSTPAFADIKIGDKAPNFANLPGTDDEKYGLKDYKKDVLVVCITCNHCPVAVMYEDRNIEFAKNFGDKVDFVAINVNTGEQDRMPKMKERAKDKGFNFSYLFDESQEIARQLGAKVTPEYYVFNKDRELIYRGAMDNSNNAKNADENYLKAAVEAALKGSKPETVSTKARGCGVRYTSK